MLYTMLTFVPPGSYRKGSLTKIKVIISFLLCLVMATANPMSMRAEIKPFYLTSKIFSREPAKHEEHKYMASLQLNGSHICSSSMFKRGFLLTANICAWNIGNNIRNELQKATAVLGNLNLKEGLRVNILKLAYYVTYGPDDGIRTRRTDDVGIITLSDRVDYRNVQVLDLYEEPISLYRHKNDFTVCGWGSVMEDDEEGTNFTNAENVENLHCIFLELLNKEFCRRMTPKGDYRRRLLCGLAAHQGQIRTLGDTGSPLTKFISVTDAPAKNHIAGVTIDGYGGENGAILRFIRISAVAEDIKQMVKHLQLQPKKNDGHVEVGRKN